MVSSMDLTTAGSKFPYGVLDSSAAAAPAEPAATVPVVGAPAGFGRFAASA